MYFVELSLIMNVILVSLGSVALHILLFQFLFYFNMFVIIYILLVFTKIVWLFGGYYYWL